MLRREREERGFEPLQLHRGGEALPARPQHRLAHQRVGFHLQQRGGHGGSAFKDTFRPRCTFFPDEKLLEQ